MPKANLCYKQGILLPLILMLCISFKTKAQNVPLVNAFAHNDYFHKRPLFDALDNGYNHIEADVYLRRGKLIVAHILPMLRRKKDLERLYFKPLEERINNQINGDGEPVYPITLMIDIKSGADGTYRKLQVLLDKYKSIISGYEDGQFVQRQITVVLSGHKPEKLLEAQDNRLAFMDADLMKTRQDTLSANVAQMASCKYSKLIKWDGKGDLPEDQRVRLCSYVSMAHKYGKKVRLWSSPDNNSVWKELLKLKNFLLADKDIAGVE
jgi:hypothetical protein